MEMLLQPLEGLGDVMGLINVKCPKNSGCNMVQGCSCPPQTEG